MKGRFWIALWSLFVCLATFGLAGLVTAQEEEKPEAPAAGPSQAEMEAYMKAAAPGEPHKRLAKMVGNWTFTNKMWMAPGQPPTESSGTMHAESILGGRYVRSVWKGDFGGMPFEGHGTDGYDNVAKQHVSSWVDNMGTGIMYSTGTCDESGKTCTSVGSTMDAVTGKKTEMKSVSKWLDDDTFTLEMYGPGPGGDETKMMEMTVKRKK